MFDGMKFLRGGWVRFAPVSPWVRNGLMLLLALGLAGHVYLAATLGLSVDEAHYALYALHPALSYFDHPPLVGWLHIPFMWLGGEDWMLRLAPFVLFVATAVWLGRWSRWALGLFLLAPIYHLLGLALTPDTLLLPLTACVMALTARLAQQLDDRASWLWLGAVLGLAGLSKYTAIFLALGAAIVLWGQHGRALVRERGAWWAVCLAALLVLPVFIWNAQHDWASFRYQLTHVSSGDGAWQLRRAVVYSVIQLLAFGALPLLGLLAWAWRTRWCPVDQAQQVQRMTLWVKLSLAFALPAWVFTFYVAGTGAALPHWTAGAWLALLPLAALGLQGLWHGEQKMARYFARLLIGALGVVQAVSILALAIAMSMGGHPSDEVADDAVVWEVGNPFADLHDWREVGVVAHRLQIKHHAKALAVSNWTLASRLAWYARPARVWALDGKNQQFDWWFGAYQAQPAGTSFVWVDWSQMPQARPSGCKRLGGSDSTWQGKHSSFNFYLCQVL